VGFEPAQWVIPEVKVHPVPEPEAVSPPASSN